MENILELQQISKTFPKSNFTLDNVSFSLPYGAIGGFVGENRGGQDDHDWVYFEHGQEGQWNCKIIWQGNAGR